MEGGDAGAEAFGDPDGVGGAGVGQQRGELLTAPAADDLDEVVAADLLPQGPGDGLEYSVAGEVAVGVVDLLEPVQVEQQQP